MKGTAVVSSETQPNITVSAAAPDHTPPRGQRGATGGTWYVHDDLCGRGLLVVRVSTGNLICEAQKTFSANSVFTKEAESHPGTRTTRQQSVSWISFGDHVFISDSKYLLWRAAMTEECRKFLCFMIFSSASRPFQLPAGGMLHCVPR